MSKKIYLFSTSSHPDAISINSLDITFFQPQIDFSKYDYLILTSKQAIIALSKYTNKDYKTKPALCISEKTAEEFITNGGEILALGAGYGDDLSHLIEKFSKNKRWVYIRAKDIASSFAQDCRAKGYKIDEAIVYSSTCSKSLASASITENSIYIFTSPSSVRCFLNQYTFGIDSEVIVIGTTTAKEIPKGIRYKIPDKRTINNCIELAYRI